MAGERFLVAGETGAAFTIACGSGAAVIAETVIAITAATVASGRTGVAIIAQAAAVSLVAELSVVTLTAPRKRAFSQPGSEDTGGDRGADCLQL